jgi:hypothetical protein
MFKKSKVSLKGRWIISLIFLVCILVPESIVLSMARKSIHPKYVIGMSLVRIMWGLPLYYFMMLGHSWARYITIVLFSLGAMMVLPNLSAENFAMLSVPLVIIIVTVGALIFSDQVKARDSRW